MRKLFVAIGILFVLSFFSQAQTIERAAHVSLDPARKSIYDSLFYANDWRVEWYKQVRNSYRKKNMDYDLGPDWMSKMLKVGDPMPDLKLGEELTNSTGKKMFSDFRGKIIILDFWSTNCVSCIAGFPKMKQLQEKFGDQIQVILVNTSQTQEEIAKIMGKNISKIPDLYSITGAKHLFPYFPRMWSPYHVWIDQKGIIRVIGSNFNTYDNKVADLLNGKMIFSYNDECTRPSFNVNIPYSKLVGIKVNPNSYSSFFTAFNNDYASKGGSTIITKEGSTYNKRETFINMTIAQLYKEAFKSISMDLASAKMVFNPSPILFEVRDTLRYTYEYVDEPVDTTFTRSMFCYEQYSTRSMPIAQTKIMMQEDLNDYFGKLYGTYGRVEKRLLRSYVIIKLSGMRYAKLNSGNKDLAYSEAPIIKNGKHYIHYKRTPLSSLFSPKIKEELKLNKTMLVNETGLDINEQIDIILPIDADLLDVKLALRTYGLDIIKKDIEVESLIISDTKGK